MKDDGYRTIADPSEGIFRDRGSKFIAHAYPVTTAEEIKDILTDLRKRYHDARHYCFAWMLGAERTDWRANDDGEPSGSAGKPILGQINSYELTDILIVVIRYFGGTLLGVGGLINAYRRAAADALDNAVIKEMRVQVTIEIGFPYIAMNDVMTILKDESLNPTDQHFDNNCRIITSAPLSEAARITERLNKVDGVTAIITPTS
jgi:uncharacterized YigZ family protein